MASKRKADEIEIETTRKEHKAAVSPDFDLESGVDRIVRSICIDRISISKLLSNYPEISRFYDDRKLIKMIYDDISETREIHQTVLDSFLNISSCSDKIKTDKLNFLTNGNRALMKEFLDSLIVYNIDGNNFRLISKIAKKLNAEEIAEVFIRAIEIIQQIADDEEEEREEKRRAKKKKDEEEEKKREERKRRAELEEDEGEESEGEGEGKEDEDKETLPPNLKMNLKVSDAKLGIEQSLVPLFNKFVNLTLEEKDNLSLYDYFRNFLQHLVAKDFTREEALFPVVARYTAILENPTLDRAVRIVSSKLHSAA